MRHYMNKYEPQDLVIFNDYGELKPAFILAVNITYSDSDMQIKYAIKCHDETLQVNEDQIVFIMHGKDIMQLIAERSEEKK